MPSPQTKNLETVKTYGEFEVIGPVRLPCEVVGQEPAELTFHYFGFPQGRYTVVSAGDPYELQGQEPQVRVSSMCIWAHLFGSQHCDCKDQLEEAKARIAHARNGLLIFCHDQHGKAVGLRNHHVVYAEGQRQGFELVIDAYECLGFREDYRNYDDAAKILKHFGVMACKLLTNSPRRIEALEDQGIRVERVPIEAPVTTFNNGELRVKKHRLGHLLSNVNGDKPLLPPANTRVQPSAEMAHVTRR